MIPRQIKALHAVSSNLKENARILEANLYYATLNGDDEEINKCLDSANIFTRRVLTDAKDLSSRLLSHTPRRTPG